MLNQSLVSTTINEPPKPSVSSKKCNWICQIITWVLLIIVIISIISNNINDLINKDDD